MKNITLIYGIIVNFLFIADMTAQNPRWITYTHGNDIYSLAEEGNSIWSGMDRGRRVEVDKSSLHWQRRS